LPMRRPRNLGDGVMTYENIDVIDGKLIELKHMAEFAADLSSGLDANDAKEGYIHLPQDKGNRWRFAARMCFAALRRSLPFSEGRCDV
jgi:hypothetical protein